METPCPNQFLRVTFGSNIDGIIIVYFDRYNVGKITGSRGDWCFVADFYRGRDDISGNYTSIAKIKKAIKERWGGIEYRGFTILIHRKGGPFDKTRRYGYHAIHRGIVTITSKILCLEHSTAIEHAKEAINDHITEGANNEV